MAVVPASAGSLDPQGPVARAMADLYWLMVVLGVAVFVLFAGLLVAALLRRPDERPDARPVSIGAWLGVGGVALPLVLIAVVFGATLVAMRATPNRPPPDALRIDVVGHQFGYDVSYPDEGVSAVDELRIPVGRPVALHLTSRDVIHSFWVPALGGKIDMLPDGENVLVLEADVPGEHLSRCAEFCGLEHAHMVLHVVAETEEAFSAWLAARR